LRRWENNKEGTYQDGSPATWHVYSTSGRGKQSRHTYVHLYRKGHARIVNEDGTPTGQRAPTVFHYRGKAQDKVGTYRAID
jgi:hypothetical protein